MKLANCLVLILVVLALLVGRALSDRGRDAVSGTRAFAIDGRTFRVEDPAADGLSLLERELASRGIDMPRGSQNPGSLIDALSVEPLREEPPDKSAFQLPRGLQKDHDLRLDTITGPVEIAFGRVDCGIKDIIERLRSSGWECRESETQGIPGAVAQMTKGKETSFVLLDQEENRFLAIRRAVR